MKFQIQAQNLKMKIGIRFLMAMVFMTGLGAYNYIVIQNANNKVAQIAEKEMPLLIAEKGLAAAVDASQEAMQGYLAGGGDFYEEQWQKQKVIILYQINTIRTAAVSEELALLFEKNQEWLTFVEKEVMAAVGDAEAASINLKSSEAKLKELQAGYAEQIAAREAAIQKLEHEVIASEQATAVLLGMMSLILAAVIISSAGFLFKKYLTPKGINVLSKTV